MVDMKVFKENGRLYIILENPPKAVEQKISSIMSGAMNDLASILESENFDSKIEAEKVDQLIEKQDSQDSKPEPKPDVTEKQEPKEETVSPKQDDPDEENESEDIVYPWE